MLRTLSLVFLLSCSSASAQTVRMHVLTDSVTVGERFGVAIAVEHAAGVQTLFPDPPDAAGAIAAPLEAGDAEFLGVRRLPPELRGESRVDSAVFQATTFALDSARVGPMEVQLVRGTDTTVIRSPVTTLGVRALVPADAQAAKGLAPLATFPRAWGPWLIAALVILALAASLWWWLRRRREPPVDTSTLPPYEEVVTRLGRLDEALPDNDAAVQPFYVELSDALRNYLARSLGVPARELTTRELLAALAGNEHVPESTWETLGDLLRRADLVKFAAFVPAADVHRTSLDRALQGVETIESELHPEPEPEHEPAL